jgi:hypothetical protein
MDRWKAGDEIQESIRTLVGEAHPHLADIVDDVIVIFREKASKKGGAPVLGKTGKAPALLSLLGERQYKFILELGADTWANLDGDQRQALLDHQLCYIGGEEDEKSGDMKYHLNEPDICYFSEEIDRRGHWRPDLTPPEEEKEETQELSKSEQIDLLLEDDDDDGNDS